MKKAWKIFTRDLRQLSTSIVFVALLIGISILPCMYGWLNVLSTWDPYAEEATSRMEIAVVSEDEGTEVYSLSINMGDEIISALKENSTIGWQFPDTADEAMEGVKNGEYYAAIAIPKDFSEDMMKFTDGDYTHPQLIYYENSKENIIASKVTEQAKSTVQDQVNGTLLGTLVKVAVEGANVVSEVNSLTTDTDDGREAYDNLIDKVRDLQEDLDSIMMLTGAMGDLTDASGDMVNAAASFLPSVHSTVDETQDELRDVFDRLNSEQASYADLRDATVIVLDEAITLLDNMETWTTTEMDNSQALIKDSRKALENLETTLDDLNNFLVDAYDKLYEDTPNALTMRNTIDDAIELIDSCQEMITPLVQLVGSDAQNITSEGKLSGSGIDVKQEGTATIPNILSEASSANARAEDLKDELDELKDTLESTRSLFKSAKSNAAETNNSMHTALDAINGDLLNLSKDLVTVEDNLLQDIADCRESLEDISADLTGEQKIDLIIDSAQDSIDAVIDALDGGDATYSTAMAALSAYSSTLGSFDGNLAETKEVVSRLQQVLQSVMLHLLEWDDDGSLDRILDFMDDDPAVLSDFLTEPVNVETIAVYEVENYGSASAPFYTLLALWAGALFTMALVKARIDDNLRPAGLRDREEFLGKYMLIFIIAELQALVTGVGITLFIGIDCAHPVLYCLGCAVAALLFSLINFALAYSMSSIGLGISVILVLLQVAGSGGSFPIEVLPEIYQKLYPYMPFKYALAMMREAVGGLYGDTYWHNLFILLLYAVATVPVGILIKKLYAPLYRRMEKAKEESGIML